MKDGLYLFRESSTAYWRLTKIKAGIATGEWIALFVDVNKLKGEWRKPTAEEIERCEKDTMGRLLEVVKPEKLNGLEQIELLKKLHGVK